jgi:cytochrome c553
MKRVGIALLALAALASSALAAAAPSIERGKELFNSVQLGTNGKSCAGCHPGGRRLKEAAGYDEKQLGDIINQCIEKPLKGKALDPASADMKSLIMYIRTFAGP